MSYFSIISDSVAVIRIGVGIFKQFPLYRRNDRVYVPHGGGFVMVGSFERGPRTWITSHPSVKLVEWRAEGVVESTLFGAKTLRYEEG